MPYIPYTLDGYVERGVLVFWAIFGVIAIVQGRRRSLPPRLLMRRAAIAVVGAFVSFAFYSVYILVRQIKEKNNDLTSGRFMSKPRFPER